MAIFKKVAIVGIGLIGSSLARVLKQDGLCEEISVFDANHEYMKKALELGVADSFAQTAAAACRGADLKDLSTPVGAYGSMPKEIDPRMQSVEIITDVGSIKKFAMEEILPNIPKGSGIVYVPGHPVAGTE